MAPSRTSYVTLNVLLTYQNAGTATVWWVSLYLSSLEKSSITEFSSTSRVSSYIASSDGIIGLELLIYSCLLFSVFSTLSQ